MSTTQANPISRPWRKLLRFSVRVMIVVVLVVGGWLGWFVRSARIQREAVVAIRRVGGLVSYDFEWKIGKGRVNGEPWAPRCLMEEIGINCFGNAVSVHSGCASEAELIHFTRLNSLA